MTFQLIYWGTYPQIHLKINLSVYPHASLSSNHQDLPVTTSTCVPAHTCTPSLPYMFIFILSFRLTILIYPSMFLLFYMFTSTDLPVHHCTCSVYFSRFGITCTMAFQLIYWGTYPQTHPKINLPVTFMLLLCQRTKTYLSSQLLVYLPIYVPVHDPTP